MIKTTLVANTASYSDKENKGIEVGIVSGYTNGTHTHTNTKFLILKIQLPILE
jgi:hypothetical protein